MKYSTGSVLIGGDLKVLMIPRYEVGDIIGTDLLVVELIHDEVICERIPKGFKGPLSHLIEEYFKRRDL